MNLAMSEKCNNRFPYFVWNQKCSSGYKFYQLVNYEVKNTKCKMNELLLEVREIYDDWLPYFIQIFNMQ